jgi:hypothetical protein
VKLSRLATSKALLGPQLCEAGGASPWRERLIMLLIARGCEGAKLGAWLRGVDWRVLELEMVRQRLLPLLGTRLTELAEAGAVDEQFAHAVDAALHCSRSQAVAQQTVAWGLMTTLESHDIPTLPLKGPFLSERLYGDPGLRISNDIDLMVPAHQIQNAIQLLEEAGWVRPRMGNALPLLHQVLVHPAGIRLELHWRLSWYEDRYADEILTRSSIDAGVRVPTPEDDLTALLLFHARDGLNGLRWPLDVAASASLNREAIEASRPARILERHPNLAPPAAAAALAVDAVMATDLAVSYGITEPGSRVALALRLADWSLARSDQQRDVATKFVDGLLVRHRGYLGFARRTAFPRLHGDLVSRVVSQPSYALHILWRFAQLALWLRCGHDRHTPMSVLAAREVS